MSINPQFQGHDQYDVMLGSVTSHFAQIDNVLLKNECIDGQYQLVTAASYAANTPVDAPGFTTVNISTSGALVADLENSYITAEIQYTLRLPGYDPTDAKISAVETAGIPETNLTKVLHRFQAVARRDQAIRRLCQRTGDLLPGVRRQRVVHSGRRPQRHHHHQEPIRVHVVQERVNHGQQRLRCLRRPRRDR